MSRGSFQQFGSGQAPIWGEETQIHPVTGQLVTNKKILGTATSSNPFTSAFGESFKKMNSLGDTIGDAFGSVNAMNLQSAEKARDRNMISNLLKQIMGSFGGGNIPGGGGQYGDFSSRQTAGTYRPQ